MPDTFRPATSRAPRGTRHSSPHPRPYDGPDLQLSPRVWHVLTPVHHELPGIRTFVLRRIARAIGQQLNDGTDEERLADRIEHRYARMPREDIRDIGSWLLAVGIVHRGCNTPSCEDGWVWPTGAACEVCAHRRQVERAWWQRARELEDRLNQLRAERLQQAEHQEQLLLPGLPVVAQAPPARVLPLPPKATYRQRDAASDAEIRAAIAEHGRTVALHIYGHLRVLPLLADAPDPETGNDRRTHAQ